MSSKKAIAAIIATNTPLDPKIYSQIGAELDALAAAHPHNYKAEWVDDLGDVVIDTTDHVQSADRCAQLMNDRDALRILLDRRAAGAAALRSQLATAQDERDSAQTSAARAREEIAAFRAVVSDATKRYSYLYDGWRKAQSNEEIADVVRKAMFNWEETRALLYEGALDPPARALPMTGTDSHEGEG